MSAAAMVATESSVIEPLEGHEPSRALSSRASCVSPGCGYVGAAFLADPGAETYQRGLRRDLSGDQGLPLMKGDRPIDQAGGTKENTAWVNAVSESEFSRISTKLSACEMTFSAIFWGR